jgi:hypothetical protein
MKRVTVTKLPELNSHGRICSLPEDIWHYHMQGHVMLLLPTDGKPCLRPRKKRRRIARARIFEVVDFVRDSHVYQDVVLLRRVG